MFKNNTYLIKSKKQDNGCFGSPYNLVYIDKIVKRNSYILESAIIIAASEIYLDSKIEQRFSDNEGFILFILFIEKKSAKAIKLKDYCLNENLLKYLKNG